MRMDGVSCHHKMVISSSKILHNVWGVPSGLRYNTYQGIVSQPSHISHENDERCEDVLQGFNIRTRQRHTTFDDTRARDPSREQVLDKQLLLTAHLEQVSHS